MYKLCPIDLDSCKVAHLEINQEIDDRSTSPYGVQQKLCRDFLSTFSRYGILVAPQRSLKEIMAVGRSDCFSDATINFEAWLTKQAVTIKAINRADCLSVEECVRFAIVVWLESHRYYRCGSDLIKGPFLGAAASSKHTKIVFTVHCTSVGEVIIRVSSETVRLLPLTTAASQLLRGRSTEEHRWVFCLPRLGRGQLVAQYRRIPDDSAFANYSEMRAYWKNCHGYDLPLEEPETYYDVLFRGFRSAFLYPDFCVLSSEPVPVHFREDYVTSAAAIDDFLLVFASRKHFICMEEVKLSMVDPNVIGFVRSLSRIIIL
ncbi:hypothetical protein KIN20_002310 [Parelaphostrongylus tenuis]|uniref:DUF4708 domain-containing protein n=1 Tax=Parelaphostrongylus tenuis TaxID=148309 RepID=A0AAD5MGE5_PARTN|nr:hypothetical protein KIN20_002310 [Parelaphostrongylus tenuis]